MSSNPVTPFPSGLRVIVNIIIAIALVSGFLALYGWGNLVTWQAHGAPVQMPAWMKGNPIVEMLLKGVGGIVAAIFAIALNLRKSPLPKTPKEIVQRTADVMTFLHPTPSVQISPPSTSIMAEEGSGGSPPQMTFVGAGTVITRKGLGILPPGVTWQDVNTTALTWICIFLVIAYLVLVIASAITAVLFRDTAPEFVVAFGSVGAGVLLASFATWVGGVTQQP